MPLGTRRLVMSNQTNLELAPHPAAKKGEGKEGKQVAVIKPFGAAVTSITTARHPLLEAAIRHPPEGELGACKVKDAKPQQSQTAQDSTTQEPPVEETKLTPAIEPPKSGDEFYCSSYAEEIYIYLMESEKKECYVINPGFLCHQPKINATNRRVVVDWLVKVHQKFDMQHETLFIAIDTLDRYLQIEKIPLDKLQLLGITCLLVASKYEEIYPPFIQEMAYVTADSYSPKQIRDMEKKILRKLDYMFNKPHMLNFLRRYSKVASVTSLEHSLAKYILELSLMQSELSPVPPSLKAASALQLALQLSPTSKRTTTPTWPAALAKHSTYKSHQLTNTRKNLKGALCYGHNHPELVATKLKFKKSRFGCVSELTVLKGLSH